MAGICKLLVGNGLRPILGPRATLPAGQGAPEESSPALGPCPQQPPVPAAAAVSLRASPSLFLCSPHLCRSHCCGSELHGETPLQVRFLGVWSVPSTPSPPPSAASSSCPLSLCPLTQSSPPRLVPNPLAGSLWLPCSDPPFPPVSPISPVSI